jgi:hypothetical protein
MTKVEKRKKPPRLETPKKQYTLHDCALYGIRGIGQLIHLLHWEGSRQELEDLPTAPGSYKAWRNDKGRLIQAVNLKETNGWQLRMIQARIAVLLRRVMPPEYRHSGVRGRSFITNAQQHLQDDPSIKLDIKSFYPTTTFQHVRRFFVETCRGCGLPIGETLLLPTKTPANGWGPQRGRGVLLPPAKLQPAMGEGEGQEWENVGLRGRHHADHAWRVTDRFGMGAAPFCPAKGKDPPR